MRNLKQEFNAYKKAAAQAAADFHALARCGKWDAADAKRKDYFAQYTCARDAAAKAARLNKIYFYELFVMRDEMAATCREIDAIFRAIFEAARAAYNAENADVLAVVDDMEKAAADAYAAAVADMDATRAEYKKACAAHDAEITARIKAEKPAQDAPAVADEETAADVPAAQDAETYATPAEFFADVPAAPVAQAAQDAADVMAETAAAVCAAVPLASPENAAAARILADVADVETWAGYDMPAAPLYAAHDVFIDAGVSYAAAYDIICAARCIVENAVEMAAEYMAEFHDETPAAAVISGYIAPAARDEKADAYETAAAYFVAALYFHAPEMADDAAAVEKLCAALAAVAAECAAQEKAEKAEKAAQEKAEISRRLAWLFPVINAAVQDAAEMAAQEKAAARDDMAAAYLENGFCHGRPADEETPVNETAQAAQDADAVADIVRRLWLTLPASTKAELLHELSETAAPDIKPAARCLAAALANATDEKPAPPVVDEYDAARLCGRVLNEKMRRQVARDAARAEKIINAQAARRA